MTADGSFGGKFKVAKSAEQIDSDAKGQVVAFRMVLRDDRGRRLKILSGDPLPWKPGTKVLVTIKVLEPDAVAD